MNIRACMAGLLLSAGVAAATPADYASQWPLKTTQEGAYAVALDEDIYRQVTRADLSDLAAYDADGEELAFGPMPEAREAPSRKWHDAVWFALPAQPAGAASDGDLQLHVSRSADGSLALDTTLSGAQAQAPRTGVQDVLVDVRAKDRVLEAVSFDFADNAPDFSADIDVQASDDLRNWRTLASAAPLANFHQHGQYLLRRKVEFDAQAATYLRIHASAPLPLLAVHQLQREPGSEPARQSLDAAFVRREENAFVYRLPARVEAQRLTILLPQDNAVAHFSIDAREEGASEWRSVGNFTAFRLRGAGVMLDAEPMEIDGSRLREWRITPQDALAQTPRLRFDYRPETWLLLTHGRAPFTLVAGSRRAHRGEFPIGALVGPLRARYGASWQPPALGHGPMQALAGQAALNGWDAQQKRTWLLWGILVFGALAIAVMVIGLLRTPRKQD